VAFAMMHAASAASVIRWTLEGTMSEPMRREMWADYDQGWQGIARSFGLSIDQWYHAIATNHPSSVYWSSRANAQMFDVRSRPFQALVDTGIAPDLLRVLSKGTDKVTDIGRSGPLVEALAHVNAPGPLDQTYRLRKDVAVKESITVDPVRGKAVQSPNPTVPIDPAAARYWTDPIRFADEVAPSYGSPRHCHRFYFKDDPSGPQVRFDDTVHAGLRLHELLASQARTHEELVGLLTPSQQLLLSRLRQAGMIELT
jgi:hypothetical protein